MTKSETIKEIKQLIKYLKKKSTRGGDDENLEDRSSSQLKKILKSYKKAYKLSKENSKKSKRSKKLKKSKRSKKLKKSKRSKKSKKSKRSKKSKKSKRSEQSVDTCSKQSTKKYKSRNSPPFPANKCCGLSKKGNDGKLYTSRKYGKSCKWRSFQRSKISKKVK